MASQDSNSSAYSCRPVRSLFSLNSNEVPVIDTESLQVPLQEPSTLESRLMPEEQQPAPSSSRTSSPIRPMRSLLNLNEVPGTEEQQSAPSPSSKPSLPSHRSPGIDENGLSVFVFDQEMDKLKKDIAEGNRCWSSPMFEIMQAYYNQAILSNRDPVNYTWPSTGLDIRAVHPLSQVDNSVSSYLNDAMINHIIENERRNPGTVLIAPTQSMLYFYAGVQTNLTLDQICDSISQDALDYTMRSVEPVRGWPNPAVFNTERAILPLNVRGNHWLVVMFRFDGSNNQGRIEVWNSMTSSTNDELTGSAVSMNKYLPQLAALMSLSPYVNRPGLLWNQSIVMMPQTQQYGDTDCGLITADTILRLMQGRDIEIRKSESEARTWGIQLRYEQLRKMYRTVVGTDMPVYPDQLHGLSNDDLGRSSSDGGMSRGREDCAPTNFDDYDPQHDEMDIGDVDRTDIDNDVDVMEMETQPDGSIQPLSQAKIAARTARLTEETRSTLDRWAMDENDEFAQKLVAIHVWYVLCDSLRAKNVLGIDQIMRFRPGQPEKSSWYSETMMHEIIRIHASGMKDHAIFTLPVGVVSEWLADSQHPKLSQQSESLIIPCPQYIESLIIPWLTDDHWMMVHVIPYDISLGFGTGLINVYDSLPSSGQTTSSRMRTAQNVLPRFLSLISHNFSWHTERWQVKAVDGPVQIDDSSCGPLAIETALQLMDRETPTIRVFKAADVSAIREQHLDMVYGSIQQSIKGDSTTKESTIWALPKHINICDWTHGKAESFQEFVSVLHGEKLFDVATLHILANMEMGSDLTANDVWYRIWNDWDIKNRETIIYALTWAAARTVYGPDGSANSSPSRLHVPCHYPPIHGPGIMEPICFSRKKTAMVDGTPQLEKLLLNYRELICNALEEEGPLNTGDVVMAVRQQLTARFPSGYDEDEKFEERVEHFLNNSSRVLVQDEDDQRWRIIPGRSLSTTEKNRIASYPRKNGSLKLMDFLEDRFDLIVNVGRISQGYDDIEECVKIQDRQQDLLGAYCRRFIQSNRTPVEITDEGELDRRASEPVSYTITVEHTPSTASLADMILADKNLKAILDTVDGKFENPRVLLLQSGFDGSSADLDSFKDILEIWPHCAWRMMVAQQAGHDVLQDLGGLFSWGTLDHCHSHDGDAFTLLWMPIDITRLVNVWSSGDTSVHSDDNTDEQDIHMAHVQMSHAFALVHYLKQDSTKAQWRLNFTFRKANPLASRLVIARNSFTLQPHTQKRCVECGVDSGTTWQRGPSIRSNFWHCEALTLVCEECEPRATGKILDDKVDKQHHMRRRFYAREGRDPNRTLGLDEDQLAKLFVCEICDCTTDSITKFIRHVKSKNHKRDFNPRNPFTKNIEADWREWCVLPCSVMQGDSCTVCYRDFATQDQYEQHLKTQGHQEMEQGWGPAWDDFPDARKCDICGQTFAEPRRQREHLLTDKHSRMVAGVEDGPLTCEPCAYKGQNERAFHAHIVSANHIWKVKRFHALELLREEMDESGGEGLEEVGERADMLYEQMAEWYHMDLDEDERDGREEDQYMEIDDGWYE